MKKGIDPFSNVSKKTEVFSKIRVIPPLKTSRVFDGNVNGGKGMRTTLYFFTPNSSHKTRPAEAERVLEKD
jgi:hypothetical protein